MQEEINLLRAQVDEMRRLVFSHRHVYLMDFGSLKAFMFTDDAAYTQYGPEFKHNTPKPIEPAQLTLRTPAERFLDGMGKQLLILNAPREDSPFAECLCASV